MIKLSKTLKYITATLFLFVFQSVPQTVAQLDPIPGVPDKAIEDVIADATNWILGIALGIAVLVLIYGGLTYVASSGSTEQAASSKKIIKYALLGVFVVGMSYIILMVINNIIG